MLTKDALLRFYKACQDKGLSPTTVKGYQAYLRHFAAEYAELPTDQLTIEDFLRRRKEGPGKRGDVFKKLQAFYSYLQKVENIPSPVPSKGKVGRPPEHSKGQESEPVQVGQFSIEPPTKLVGGGQYTLEVHVYLHLQGCPGISPAP